MCCHLCITLERSTFSSQSLIFEPLLFHCKKEKGTTFYYEIPSPFTQSLTHSQQICTFFFFSINVVWLTQLMPHKTCLHDHLWHYVIFLLLSKHFLPFYFFLNILYLSSTQSLVTLRDFYVSIVLALSWLSHSWNHIISII